MTTASDPAASLSSARQSAVDPGQRNLVVPVLVASAAAATLGCGFVTLAPNRLVSGQPIGLLAAVGPYWGGLIAIGFLGLLGIAIVPRRHPPHRAAALLAGALLLVILAAAGQAAQMLSAAAPAVARVSLGAGFWVLLAAAALALVDALQRAAAGAALQVTLAALVALAVVLMAHLGLFDALSLAREYDARQSAFAAALLRHILLVSAAVGAAIAIGVPLGVAAARRPDWRGPLFAILNVLQTIPSIALFGLLLEPLAAVSTAVPALAALGIGGVGPAPALVALVLYALLPVVRNTLAGIIGVDAAVLDAARGMGMTPRQLWWRVELPLALPLFFAGLRIVTVQTIGLAVVAALIGAGGLGTFVFAGLGQYATDLVLLGALPAILLALAADLVLQSLSVAVR